MSVDPLAVHALRYDTLYDSLTPKERKDVENTFRRFIQHELDHPYVNTRISLLPNMQLPRLCAAQMMSVALKDEKLIRRLWEAPSAFRWFGILSSASVLGFRLG